MKKILLTLMMVFITMGSMVSMTHSVEVGDAATNVTPIHLREQAPFSKGFNVYLNGDHVRQDLDSTDLRTNIGKIKFIHDIGGDVVRIPLHFLSTMNNEDHRVDHHLIQSLHALINEVAKPEYQPMHIIIDNHDGGESFTKIINSEHPLSPHDTMMVLWHQLADEFKDVPNFVVFELKNEPDWDDVISQQEWVDTQADLVNEIREIDTNHSIIMTEWAKATANPTRNPFYTRAGIANKKIILNVHFYCPALFSANGFPNNNFDKVGNIQWPYDASNFPLPDEYRYLEYIDSQSLDHDDSQPVEHYSVAAQDFFIQHILNEYVIKANELDAPLFVGEWGTGGKPEIAASRLKYYKFISQEFNQRGISWTSWNLDDYHYTPLDISKHTSDFLYENDLNTDLIKAMGLHSKKIPEMGVDDFVIYDEDAHWTKNYGIWWGEFYDNPYATRFDTDGNDSLLNVKFTGGYRDLRFQLMDIIDTPEFIRRGYTVEFDAKLDSTITAYVGFANSGNSRANKPVTLVGDHQYHHYSVTLEGLNVSDGLDINQVNTLSIVGGTADCGDVKYDNIVLKAPN